MSRRAKWHARVRFRLEPELGSWPKPHARVPFRFRPEMGHWPRAQARKHFRLEPEMKHWPRPHARGCFRFEPETRRRLKSAFAHYWQRSLPLAEVSLPALSCRNQCRGGALNCLRWSQAVVTLKEGNH